MTVSLVGLAALLMAGLGAVVSLLCHVWLAVRLRRRHEEVWAALGRPSLASRSRRSFEAVRRYCGERRHLGLGDQLLNRVARVERVASAARLVGIVIFLAALVHAVWSAL